MYQLPSVVMGTPGYVAPGQAISSASLTPAQVIVATSAPEPSANAVPTPPADATAAIAGQPAAAEPIVQLRALLVNGAADKQIGKDGDALIAKLDAMQGALAQGDAQSATTQLQELQQQLLSGARSGMIAPEVMRQALTGIDGIARSAGLTLPFLVTPG